MDNHYIEDEEVELKIVGLKEDEIQFLRKTENDFLPRAWQWAYWSMEKDREKVDANMVIKFLKKFRKNYFEFLEEQGLKLTAYDYSLKGQYGKYFESDKPIFGQPRIKNR